MIYLRVHHTHYTCRAKLKTGMIQVTVIHCKQVLRHSEIVTVNILSDSQSKLTMTIISQFTGIKGKIRNFTTVCITILCRQTFTKCLAR